MILLLSPERSYPTQLFASTSELRILTSEEYDKVLHRSEYQAVSSAILNFCCLREVESICDLLIKNGVSCLSLIGCQQQIFEILAQYIQVEDYALRVADGVLRQRAVKTATCICVLDEQNQYLAEYKDAMVFPAEQVPLQEVKGITGQNVLVSYFDPQVLPLINELAQALAARNEVSVTEEAFLRVQSAAAVSQQYFLLVNGVPRRAGAFDVAPADLVGFRYNGRFYRLLIASRGRLRFGAGYFRLDGGTLSLAEVGPAPQRFVRRGEPGVLAFGESARDDAGTAAVLQLALRHQHLPGRLVQELAESRVCRLREAVVFEASTIACGGAPIYYCVYGNSLLSASLLGAGAGGTIARQQARPFLSVLARLELGGRLLCVHELVVSTLEQSGALARGAPQSGSVLLNIVYLVQDAFRQLLSFSNLALGNILISEQNELILDQFALLSGNEHMTMASLANICIHLFKFAPALLEKKQLLGSTHFLQKQLILLLQGGKLLTQSLLQNPYFQSSYSKALIIEFFQRENKDDQIDGYLVQRGYDISADLQIFRIHFEQKCYGRCYTLPQAARFSDLLRHFRNAIAHFNGKQQFFWGEDQLAIESIGQLFEFFESKIECMFEIVWEYQLLQQGILI